MCTLFNVFFNFFNRLLCFKFWNAKPKSKTAESRLARLASVAFVCLNFIPGVWWNHSCCIHGQRLSCGMLSLWGRWSHIAFPSRNEALDSETCMFQWLGARSALNCSLRQIVLSRSPILIAVLEVIIYCSGEQVCNPSSSRTHRFIQFMFLSFSLKADWQLLFFTSWK